MELNDLLKKRRSVRHYTKETVSRDHLRLLIEAAQFAPVSCNLQLTKYIIIDDAKCIEHLKQSVSYKFAYTPSYILVLQDNRFSIARSSGVMSAGMATQNILLKAVELGLATCAMAGFTKDSVLRKILSIPKEYDILLIIAVGVQDTTHHSLPIPKLNLTETYSFNSFQGLCSINASLFLRDHTPKSVIDYRRRIAPVYLDRFHLNTFVNEAYDLAHSLFEEHVAQKKGTTCTVFDVMSYDGVWLKTVHEKNKNSTLISSDYLQEHVRFFMNTFGCEGVVITDTNQCVHHKKVPVATCVFQAEFTPQLCSLFTSVAQILETDGIFFITTYHDVWYVRIFRWFEKQYNKYIQNKTYNIYENSLYYKVGPHTYRSSREMKKILISSGLTRISMYRKKLSNRGRAYVLGYVAQK